MLPVWGGHLRYLVPRCTLPPMVVTADVLSQLRRGALEYCVLGLLAGEERYGFDIARTLGSIDGMVTGARSTRCFPG